MDTGRCSSAAKEIWYSNISFEDEDEEGEEGEEKEDRFIESIIMYIYIPNKVESIYLLFLKLAGFRFLRL